MADEQEVKASQSKMDRKTKIEEKIKKHEKAIEKLEEDLKNLDKPKERKGREKGIKRIIVDGKLTDTEVATALGFENTSNVREKLMAAVEAKNREQ